MFTNFLSFPPEIHSLILEACPPNDRLCLRLASTYMWNLQHSGWNPQKLPITLPLLHHSDDSHLCGKDKHPIKEAGKTPLRIFDEYTHQCHFLSKQNAAIVAARRKGLDASKFVQVLPDFDPYNRILSNRYAVMRCSANFRNRSHCLCFGNELWKQLDSWMKAGLGPQDWRYCKECNIYTKRAKAHKGKCYHGIKKPRKQQRHFWTRRRGYYAPRSRHEWRRGFNNAAMKRYEMRVRSDREGSSRPGAERYAMRSLQGRQDCNSASARACQDRAGW